MKNYFKYIVHRYILKI